MGWNGIQICEPHQKREFASLSFGDVSKLGFKNILFLLSVEASDEGSLLYATTVAEHPRDYSNIRVIQNIPAKV